MQHSQTDPDVRSYRQAIHRGSHSLLRVHRSGSSLASFRFEEIVGNFQLELIQPKLARLLDRALQNRSSLRSALPRGRCRRWVGSGNWAVARRPAEVSLLETPLADPGPVASVKNDQTSVTRDSSQAKPERAGLPVGNHQAHLFYPDRVQRGSIQDGAPAEGWDKRRKGQ